MTSAPIAGDYVSIKARAVDIIPDYAYGMQPLGMDLTCYVRTADVAESRKAFRGRVLSVAGDSVKVEAFSPSDQYEVDIPIDIVVVLPYAEKLTAGHKYRQFGTFFSPVWLYDGEAFYPVDTFPHGAVDRDQLPPRLEDLGHLRDA